jgi:hypothetical protein
MGWQNISPDCGFKTLFAATVVLSVIAYPGCITPPHTTTILATSTPTPSPSPSPTSTATMGANAVKILFQTSANGSFDAPSDANGTAPNPGNGLQAVRIFKADNSPLASGGPSGTGWPKWFTSFEMGLSGSRNTSAIKSSCAKFADASESATTNCNLGNSSFSSCGAAAGQFRISESDCKGSGVGNGGPADELYFRAVFNRTPSSQGLGTTENLMVVIEYTATGLNPAPTDPTACLSGGTFNPENCADYVWRAFLKKTPTDNTLPFLLIVPPVYSSVLIMPTPGASSVPYPGGAASMLVSKQFILPLATDQTLTTLQISRTGSLGGNDPLKSNLDNYCNANRTADANTPLCSGMVFYSITFYRI